MEIKIAIHFVYCFRWSGTGTVNLSKLAPDSEHSATLVLLFLRYLRHTLKILVNIYAEHTITMERLLQRQQ